MKNIIQDISPKFLKGKKAFICLSLFASLCSVQAFSNNELLPTNSIASVEQEIIISGKIVDVSGNPIIGATLVVKGQNSQGTITNIDGNFSMKAARNSVIVITSVGYEKKEIAASQLQNATITLEESTQMVDEVIVVGYGTKKKRDITGSIASIGAKEIQNRPVSDVLSAMQGKVAGVAASSAVTPSDAKKPSHKPSK